ETLLLAKVDFRPPRISVTNDFFSDDNFDPRGIEASGSADGSTDFDPPDELIELIKTTVAPGTWQGKGGGGPGRIFYYRGRLVITQTCEAHLQIAELLTGLG
ncbi:unnamed protein product, partial [marine sediment metagenome]